MYKVKVKVFSVADMETPVLLWFHLLLSVIVCHGFHVHGPSGPLTAQMGDSVMLPCFVETPLPMEELEVEWKRIDSGSLVHLWQNGESRPESQNWRYHERAHFFTEEVARGNFSLLLTNMTQEDAGVYKCVVYKNQDSDQTLIEIMEIERFIVSGTHIISVYVGEDITLNCSVDSHIPSEKIEEVSWKKTDEEILVLLYQEGDIMTESTHERFMGRVEFFSAEDRNKGNFSMRLKDVRTEDKGLYMCLAFSGDLSDNTTVQVQPQGFSSANIGMIVLCILVFVIGPFILGYLYFKKKDNSRRARIIQCAIVLCPNITMSIVFILWGVSERVFTEAATCSALNFVRICFLIWITFLFWKSFKDDIPQSINILAVPVQYFVINVAYIPFIMDIWHKINTTGKVWMLILFLTGPVVNILSGIVVFCRKNNADHKITTLIILVLAAASVTLDIPLGIIFTFNYVVVNVKEQAAFICMTVSLRILNVISLITVVKHIKDIRHQLSTRHQKSNSNSTYTVTQLRLWRVFVFVNGSVLVVFVNAAALLVIELILKARNVERTVDLRAISITTECLFVCLLALLCKKNRKRTQHRSQPPVMTRNSSL